MESRNINVAESNGSVNICVRVSSGTVSSPGTVSMATFGGSAERGTLVADEYNHSLLTTLQRGEL